MKTIPLTRGQVALVDDQDYERVSAFKWRAEQAARTGMYAVAHSPMVRGVRKDHKMHRFILGLTDPHVFADHIDGNGLNNQRYNLRVCTYEENNRNRGKRTRKSSRFKGVSWVQRDRRWIVSISVRKKLIPIGRYVDELEAALAYDAAAIKYFGKFAKLNIRGIVP